MSGYPPNRTWPTEGTMWTGTSTGDEGSLSLVDWTKVIHVFRLIRLVVVDTLPRLAHRMIALAPQGDGCILLILAVVQILHAIIVLLVLDELDRPARVIDTSFTRRKASFLVGAISVGELCLPLTMRSVLLPPEIQRHRPFLVVSSQRDHEALKDLAHVAVPHKEDLLDALSFKHGTRRLAVIEAHGPVFQVVCHVLGGAQVQLHTFSVWVLALRPNSQKRRRHRALRRPQQAQDKYHKHPDHIYRTHEAIMTAKIAW